MAGELELIAEFEAAGDDTTAANIRFEGSQSQRAVDERVQPVVEQTLLENPSVIEDVATSAAEKAQSDAGLARGIVAVDRIVVAGTVDADGRAADNAIGLDGHFFDHTYEEILRRQRYVRLPSESIVAGTIDEEGRGADNAIGPDGHFFDFAIANIASRIGKLQSTGVVFPELTAAGDSLMETVGTNTPQLIGSNLSIPAHNAGKSGMTMEHIALTMGGVHVRFNVTGGALGSAASAVSLTLVSPVRGSGAFRIGSNDYTWHGYFTGASGQRVHGVLAQRATTGAWDFTPYTAGPSVAMLPGALFTPYLPTDMRSTILLINGGRNNPYDVPNGSWAHVAEDLDNTIEALGHDRFVVLTITTRLISAERIGEPQRVLIDEENARRVAKYPNNCFDLNRWMHESAVGYLGLPADPQDQTDLAQGWIPRRLYIGDAVNDQTHFKPTVYTAWAAVLADFIIQKEILP